MFGKVGPPLDPSGAGSLPPTALFSSEHSRLSSCLLQAGKFDIIPTMINVGSGLALLGVVSGLELVLLAHPDWTSLTSEQLSEHCPSPTTLRPGCP